MKDDKRIERYIDKLNDEQMPKEHKNRQDNVELEVLMETVRRVKSLKEPVMPEENFQVELSALLQTKITGNRKRSSRFIKRFVIPLTTVAAAIVLIFALPALLPDEDINIVQAMEQALDKIEAYHGTIEVVETNGLGEQMLQSSREVWADREGNYRLEEQFGFQKGMITVNNGLRKWQLRPEENKAYLFSSFPDPYRFTFELGSEIEGAIKALSVEEIGDEVISGREAVLIKITPDGGEPYLLWIDKKTDLPLQKQSALQNSLQVTITYSQIEYLKDIPWELLAYKLPEGYVEIDSNPEQAVSSLEEAKDLAGFLPKIEGSNIPGYQLYQIAVLTESKAIKYTYKAEDTDTIVVFLQSELDAELEPDSRAVLGAVNSNPAEILSNYQGQSKTHSIRWIEGGMEFTLYGNITVDALSAFTSDIAACEVVIPKDGETDMVDEEIKKPQIEVPVDLTVEENDQKSVDAGHSPWKLDPAFVAQVFASMLLSPEGILGEYPIPYEEVEIIENNGVKAIAHIGGDKTIAEFVYLERLVRKDDTGIWTVVGYDRAVS